MASVKRFSKGDLVAFKTVAFGMVNAHVVEGNRYVPLMGERVKVRISSRKNKGYPIGMIYEFTPGSLIFRPRVKKGA